MPHLLFVYLRSIQTVATENSQPFIFNFARFSKVAL